LEGMRNILTYRFFSSLSIKDRIKSELFLSMRAKQSNRTNLIRQLQSELAYFEKSKSCVLHSPTESDYLGVLQGCVDKWMDAIHQYQVILENDSSRECDLKKMIAKEQEELEIIKSFLPLEYTREELKIMFDCAAKGKSLSVGSVIKSLDGNVDYGRISRKRLVIEIAKYLQTL
jgi:uncharacterized protein YqeY